MNKFDIATFPQLVNRLEILIGAENTDYYFYGIPNSVAYEDICKASDMLEECETDVIADMARANYKYDAQRMADMMRYALAAIPDDLQELRCHKADVAPDGQRPDNRVLFHYVNYFRYLCKRWIARLVDMYGIKAPSLKEPQAKAENPQQASAKIENGAIVDLPYKLDDNVKSIVIKRFNKAVKAKYITILADGRLRWDFPKIENVEQCGKIAEYRSLVYFITSVISNGRRFPQKVTAELFGIENANSIDRAVSWAKNELDKAFDDLPKWAKTLLENT